jgi:hypothetical protein
MAVIKNNSISDIPDAFSSGYRPAFDNYIKHFYIFISRTMYCMGSPIPRPAVAQAVVVILAAALFTCVLTIAGSGPTSDVPERTLRNANLTAAPGHENDFSATVTPVGEPAVSPAVAITSLPGPEVRPVVTNTPVPDLDGMITQPDMNLVSLPVNFSGNGSQATQSFSLLPGIISFDLWTDSPGNLEVWLIYNGERFLRLSGDGAIADSPVIETICEGGTYFLDVTADGKWQINVARAESG